MTKKYDKEYIKNILESKKYKIIGEIKSANDKVLCKDENGYKFLVTPMGIIRRNDKTNVFSSYNPYTIENIKLWIRKNNLTCQLISNDYINSKTNLEFLCECGKTYHTTTSELFNGKKYCNFCAKSKRYDTVDFTDYNSLVEEECKKRNYTLLPNQNIKRSDTKFYYICNKHKEYGLQQSYPNNFITNYGTGGCYQCGVNKRSLSKRKDDSYFKKLTEQTGMIYCGVEYSNNDRTRIKYQCPKHMHKGIISTYITNMKRNLGNCPYCVGRFRTKEDLQKEIDILKLNIDILDYNSYSESIKVKCRICNHEWDTKGVYLTQGVGCPSCVKSKFELSVQSFLDEHNIYFIPQYKFKNCKDKNPLPFDFFLPKYNTVIETDGEGHYIPIKWSSNFTDDDAQMQLRLVQKHDKIKNNYCIKNNINIIRIPYWEKNNMRDILIQKLNL